VYWVPDVLGTEDSTALGSAGKIFRVVEALALRLPADRLIAISDTTRNKLVGLGIDPTKIAVIPCGFEPAISETLRSDRMPGPPSIVVVSRLVSYKHVEIVLHGFARVREMIPAATLTIIGQGPERGALEMLCRHLGLQQSVRFTGFVRSHQGVIEEIAAARCFVSASAVEGFGIAFVESMSVGTPYVISDIPAHREVSGGGIGGALVPFGDPEALAAELIKALSDDHLWYERSAAGVAHSARYRWDEIAKATSQVYIQAIASK
jgi:glycosyltransferase involved in cell wall biosynthesis